MKSWREARPEKMKAVTAMIDKAKVIKGLECCNHRDGDCKSCPYFRDSYCDKSLNDDAIALIKDSVLIQPLSIYLGLYAPAPEKAPDDWTHRLHENVEAWETFLRDAEENRCYTLPVMDDGN